MNTHEEIIKFVKEYLDNPDSKTLIELETCKSSAHLLVNQLAIAAEWAASHAWASAYHASNHEDDRAPDTASVNRFKDAKYWVNEYEKLAQKEG